MRTHLNTPQAELAGQTVADLILTECAETWVNTRRSETRRQILAALANRLLHPAQLPAETAADPLPQLSWLLGQLSGGIAFTQTGNLNQKFVQQNAEVFGWDFPRPPRTEDDLYDLHQLRHLAPPIRLTRRSGRTHTLTTSGRRLLADPHQLWRATAAGLLAGNNFSVFAGELFLALLVDGGTMPYGEVKATVAQAASEEGFRESRRVSHRMIMTSGGPSTRPATCATPSACWHPAATAATAATSSLAPARPPPSKRCEPGPPAPGQSRGPEGRASGAACRPRLACLLHCG